MSVDPSDPETFEENDAAEFVVEDVEAPEVDAAEQHHDLLPNRDEPVNADALAEANEADRMEQARIVEVDEDDYL
ncbi:hypothetical protein B7755_029625 [Streptomyces sp. NBS 14/10]|uniref:hypothetical protein n=1 Tax=Streptomyces sp. NBS 14/10 TaxID=1945643 RepID=UPI000B7CAD9E|nr:hypothetical protein [Streptomyces sp. NBS 14/10]KAK1181936.1 hypothetical protein B7755_029625 [Streptomyces sp. NBS 14/10]NUS87475.1 hypothetical protein [Streptomyces sp.]